MIFSEKSHIFPYSFCGCRRDNFNIVSIWSVMCSSHMCLCISCNFRLIRTSVRSHQHFLSALFYWYAFGCIIIFVNSFCSVILERCWHLCLRFYYLRLLSTYIFAHMCVMELGKKKITFFIYLFCCSHLPAMLQERIHQHFNDFAVSTHNSTQYGTHNKLSRGR
jgi:hypothetical protein